MNIRRLAAVDMYGTGGTMRRMRLILAEFTAALAVMVTLGIWLATSTSSLGIRILGIWLIGAGLNYAPLTANAIALSRPGALDAELANVDTGRELRRYSVLQLWILVPLSLIAIAIINRGQRPAPDQLRRYKDRVIDLVVGARHIDRRLSAAGHPLVAYRADDGAPLPGLAAEHRSRPAPARRPRCHRPHQLPRRTSRIKSAQDHGPGLDLAMLPDMPLDVPAPVAG